MSDVKDILKSIGGELRKAQNLMFSKKFADAVEIVKTLNMLLDDAVALDPGNVQVKTYTNQIAKLQKDLDQRMGVTAQPAAPAASPAAAPASAPAATPKTTPAPPAPRASVQPAGSAASPAGPAARQPAASPSGPASAQPPVAAPAAPAKPAGLPAGVQKRIRDIHDLLRRRKPQDALGLISEITRQYGGQFDETHPDYVDAKQQAETAVAELENAQVNAQADRERLDRERAEREAVSQEWEQRLKGIKPFCVTTADMAHLLEQQQVYEEARKVFAEYSAVEFPFGKTYGLEQAEKKIASDIDAFPAFFAESRRRAFDEAMNHLTSRRSQLGTILEGKPAFMSDGSIRQTETFLEKYRILFPDGSDENAKISAVMAELLEKNRVNKIERSKLIFIADDHYRGEDADAIKERMVQFVLAADSKAQIVKTSVYKPEWKEVSQWEDYAGTQRFVTRGEINGQVIARTGSGPLLYTIYITKERKSDGTWTQLTGNVMFTDQIAEENIG